VLQLPFLCGGEKIYAIVEIGGKQYKVAPNQTIQVERLGVPEGQPVELDRVLFIGEDGNRLVGNPTIKGAKVVATSLGNTKLPRSEGRKGYRLQIQGQGPPRSAIAGRRDIGRSTPEYW
jgi:ribosomal protein L21